MDFLGYAGGGCGGVLGGVPIMKRFALGVGAFSSSLSVGLAVAIAGAFNFAALADPNNMALTPAGASEFTLSTFVDNFPTTGFCCGPLGIAFPTTGGAVMV